MVKFLLEKIEDLTDRKADQPKMSKKVAEVFGKFVDRKKKTQKYPNNKWRLKNETKQQQEIENT